MSCPSDKLELLHDGELPPADRDAVRAHVEGCASCRAEAERLGKLDAALARVPAGPQPKWDAYVARVRARTRGGWSRRIAAAAAVLLVGFTAWNVYEAAKPKPGTGGTLGDPETEARDALRQFGAAQTGADRDTAFARIRACGDAALPVLVAALDDPSVRIQIAAAQILSRIKDDKVRQLLVERARKQVPASNGTDTWTLDSPDARSVAVAMRRAEQEGDAARLIDVVGRGALDREVREALSKWVATLLASPSAKLRALGLAIVREVDVEFPWSAVLELVDAPEVGPQAIEVLKERTGRDFGTDKKAWKKFVEEM
ncbi:MAG: zf-HC2 domain-containing protein [Planctomycetes bacterium]|nr:zf-HC2 domain-containing protein [Planctomycetota bacterium]